MTLSQLEALDRFLTPSEQHLRRRASVLYTRPIMEIVDDLASCGCVPSSEGYVDSEDCELIQPAPDEIDSSWFAPVDRREIRDVSLPVRS